MIKFQAFVTKVSLGVLPSPMSTFSKGPTDVNPYTNLSKSLNFFIMLIAEETDALYRTADHPAIWAGPSRRGATICRPLYSILNHPTIGARPSMNVPSIWHPLCKTPNYSASRPRPSVMRVVTYSSIFVVCIIFHL